MRTVSAGSHGCEYRAAGREFLSGSGLIHRERSGRVVAAFRDCRPGWPVLCLKGLTNGLNCGFKSNREKPCRCRGVAETRLGTERFRSLRTVRTESASQFAPCNRRFQRLGFLAWEVRRTLGCRIRTTCAQPADSRNKLASVRIHSHSKYRRCIGKASNPAIFAVNRLLTSQSSRTLCRSDFAVGFDRNIESRPPSNNERTGEISPWSFRRAPLDDRGQATQRCTGKRARNDYSKATLFYVSHAESKGTRREGYVQHPGKRKRTNGEKSSYSTREGCEAHLEASWLADSFYFFLSFSTPFSGRMSKRPLPLLLTTSGLKGMSQWCQSITVALAMVANAQINPSGYYDKEAVSKLLGIPASTVSRAVNALQLRSSKRGGKLFFRGQWLIDWLEGEDSQPAESEELAAS